MQHNFTSPPLTAWVGEVLTDIGREHSEHVFVHLSSILGAIVLRVKLPKVIYVYTLKNEIYTTKSFLSASPLRLLQKCLGCSRFYALLSEFQNYPTNFYKKSLRDFDQNFTESIVQFGEACQLQSTDSSNLWAWTYIPIYLGLFFFFLEWQFSVYNSYTYFVRFTLEYFIFLHAIINGIFLNAKHFSF